MGAGGERFIANETFTDEETGEEYVQGGIYQIDDKSRPSVRQWTQDGKVRDPDVEQSPEERAEEAKARLARRESHDNPDATDGDDDNGDEDTDDLTPEEIDRQIDEEDDKGSAA
jgi:hypothetical protein